MSTGRPALSTTHPHSTTPCTAVHSLTTRERVRTSGSTDACTVPHHPPAPDPRRQTRRQYHDPLAPPSPAGALAGTPLQSSPRARTSAFGGSFCRSRARAPVFPCACAVDLVLVVVDRARSGPSLRDVLAPRAHALTRASCPALLQILFSPALWAGADRVTPPCAWPPPGGFLALIVT